MGCFFPSLGAGALRIRSFSGPFAGNWIDEEALPLSRFIEDMTSWMD